MSKIKEFEIHNEKGVLYGRYSTEEFSRKYTELYEQNEKLKNTIKVLMSEFNLDLGEVDRLVIKGK